MSRIGKQPIAIPAGVVVSISDDNVVKVKGTLGELTQKVDSSITVRVEDNQVLVERHSDEGEHPSKHGLYRALIANMVKGVSEGFKAVLELVGVGYRASNQEQLLDLSLGYSHHIYMQISPEVKLETLTEKGKNPIITLTSFDRQLLGQVAAKIRSLRKPEPYKGKGIKFKGEVLRRKAGKTAAS
jgi:large subunit ribosomal protein L6